MSKILGIIAEDESDVLSVFELIKRVQPNKNLAYRSHFGGGCGRIRSKCLVWANNLKIKGCGILILVHDLDQNNLKTLLRNLESILSDSPINNYFICIPVQELEAWLLSDAQCLKKIFNLKKLPKVPPNPELIDSPKEYLSDLIKRNSEYSKIYLHTKHNPVIAKNISLSKLISKCKSFELLHNFVIKNI